MRAPQATLRLTVAAVTGVTVAFMLPTSAPAAPAKPSATAAAKATARFCGVRRYGSGPVEVHATRVGCTRARRVARRMFQLPPVGNSPGSPKGWGCARITGNPPTGFACMHLEDVGREVAVIAAPSGPPRRSLDCFDSTLYINHGLGAVTGRGMTCAIAMNTLAYWLAQQGRNTTLRGPTGYRCKRTVVNEPAGGTDYRCRRGKRRLVFNLGGG